MEKNEIYLAILLLIIGTAICRIVPVLLLAGRQLPKPIKIFLHFCPVAILCAMVAPQVFLMNGNFDISLENKFFWVFIPSLAVAIKTRNIPATVVAGISLLAIWRLIEG